MHILFFKYLFIKKPTFGHEPWEWDWCNAGYCTWLHIRTAWKEQSGPQAHGGCRKHNRWAAVACKALGYMNTEACGPPPSSGCVCLHTSQGWNSPEHQLMKKKKVREWDKNVKSILLFLECRNNNCLIRHIHDFYSKLKMCLAFTILIRFKMYVNVMYE